MIDDGRTYMLYLAWFGPGLIKVGLTAAERGRDRLLEQGAIAYTPLATGPHRPIRRAEILISAAGFAAERLSARIKADAWWKLPYETERAQEINARFKTVADRLTWPEDLDLAPCAIIDQAAEFGRRRIATRRSPAWAMAHGSPVRSGSSSGDACCSTPTADRSWSTCAASPGGP